MIGETANVLEVTEGMVGQKISVTATDADGKVLESLETDAVKGEDKSAEVSIVDAYGTNADGTGIVGDRLELTYGASFGTPTAVTWYRDGAVVTTAGGNTYQNMNQDGGLFLNVTAARGTGNYKAVVVADGVPYETNELTISANEDPAIIESFTIEDDYTDGTDVTYAATDTTAVATVKMNKNFQGTFRIYKKTDSKFATTVDTLNTALAPAGGIAAAADDATATSNDGFSHLVANAATNYNVLQMTPGSGEGFIARDGKATYKFAVNAGLVRGTEYVVVFDQTSRSDDNIGSGTENKFATAVTAPYLTAPATAEITKAAKNAAVEITFKDKEGNILTYMGKQTARTGVTTTNPSVNGIRVKAGSAIYSATKSGVEIKDATNQNTAQNSALTAGAVKAGVWTSGVTVTGTDAFWFANITFEKGVYGKDEITIRTADKQVAQDAGAATISYDVKTPKDAKVSFTNLRAKSTVYLVCLNDTAAAGKSTAQPTVSNETASTAFKRVYENPTTEAVASATVEPGTATYTFEGAIDGIHMGDGSSTTLPGNSYIAVIIPDDETNYSPTYTAINNPTYTAGNWAATANGFDVTPTLVSYKLNSWFATSGNTVAHDATNVYCVEDGAVVHGNTTATANKADGYLLEFIDQFGNHMDQTNAAAEDHTWNLTPDDSEMDQDAKAQIEFASGATTSTKTAVLNKLFDTMNITVTAGSGPAALKKGQSFSAKLATGQTLTLTATANATGVATGAYTLSIK